LLSNLLAELYKLLSYCATNALARLLGQTSDGIPCVAEEAHIVGYLVCSLGVLKEIGE